MGPLTTLLVGVITSFITIIGAHLVTILKKEWTKSWNLKVFHPKGKGETWTQTINCWVPAVSFFWWCKTWICLFGALEKSLKTSLQWWFYVDLIRYKSVKKKSRPSTNPRKAMSMYKSLGHNAPPPDGVADSLDISYISCQEKSDCWRSNLHITNWASLRYTCIWRRCLEQKSKHLLPHAGEP